MTQYAHGYSVTHCLQCARTWATVPWPYFVNTWIRMSYEAGTPDPGEIASIQDLLANTERRSSWLKKIEAQRAQTIKDTEELRRKATLE